MASFLRDRRVSLRISQMELAEKLGVSQQTVARWETSGSIPAKYIKDLAVSLGARAQDFLPGAVPAATEATTRRPGVWTEDGDVVVQLAGEEAPRHFPVSGGTLGKISEALGDGGCGFYKADPWLQFESLDNKWVVINTAQIERLSMVDDNLESGTSYEHEEVYRAARTLCRNMPTQEAMRAEGFPYSEALMEKARKVVELNGDDAAIVLDGLTCTFISGAVVREPMTTKTAESLEYLFDQTDRADIEPNTFFNLTQEEGKLIKVRLSSVRVIVASLISLNDAFDGPDEGVGEE